MVCDKLERAGRYLFLNKHFVKAFEFIKKNDLKAFEPGKYEIDENNAFIIIAFENPVHDFAPKLEAHRKYIDIQMSLSGSFRISWKAIEGCKHLVEPYNEDKDIMFFSDSGEFDIIMNPGNFVVLMPEDAHCPHPPTNALKKAVIKILV